MQIIFILAGCFLFQFFYVICYVEKAKSLQIFLESIKLFIFVWRRGCPSVTCLWQLSKSLSSTWWSNWHRKHNYISMIFVKKRSSVNDFLWMRVPFLYQDTARYLENDYYAIWIFVDSRRIHESWSVWQNTFNNPFGYKFKISCKTPLIVTFSRSKIYGNIPNCGWKEHDYRSLIIEHFSLDPNCF